MLVDVYIDHALIESMLRISQNHGWTLQNHQHLLLNLRKSPILSMIKLKIHQKQLFLNAANVKWPVWTKNCFNNGQNMKKRNNGQTNYEFLHAKTPSNTAKPVQKTLKACNWVNFMQVAYSSDSSTSEHPLLASWVHALSE